MIKEEDKNKVKSYDFRRPIKLSKEYTNTLYMILEKFSKIAGNMLSNQLHTNLTMNISTIEQISYDEFISSIPKSTLIGLFHSKPLGGSQMLAVNSQFCLQIIELMCGGRESVYGSGLTKKESFTEIELGILDEIVASILKAFEVSWSEIINVEVELDSLETNSQLIQKMSPNEPVVLASFVIEINKNRSFVNICIPFMSFENIIEKLSIRNWFDTDKESSLKEKEVLTKRIMSSFVNLEVVLGEAALTVNNFLHLEVGDILPLNVKITDPLQMYVEDRLHYLIKPGELNGKMAAQILKYVEGEIER